MSRLLIYLPLLLLGLGAAAQNGVSLPHDHFMGKVYEVFPGADFKALLDALQPGDQLVFHEGVYRGRIVVDVSGLPDYPIIIRGYGNGEKRPVFSYSGQTANLLSIQGNNLVFDYLEIRSAHTYGVRIGSVHSGSNNITIANCLFSECGGGTISANYYNVSYDNIRILNNYFNGPKRTPVYIGSHPGNTPVRRFIFRGNVIDGSQNDGPESTIGYGIELKLNVTASIIENNYFIGTKGPGIMVYGSRNTEPDNSNIVRNNIVVNAREEAGIVVGGGPSVVQNNLIIHCHKGGMYVQDYDHRHLLRNIVITGNTLIDNKSYGISYGSAKDVLARDNLVITRSGTNAYLGKPQKGINKESYGISTALDTLTRKILHRVPAPEILQEMWRRVSSGPLTKAQARKLMGLIIRHSRPTVAVH